VVRTQADLDLLLEKHAVLSTARIASEKAYIDMLAAKTAFEDTQEKLVLAANDLENVYKAIEKRDGA
jgi:hypothetical protein